MQTPHELPFVGEVVLSILGPALKHRLFRGRYVPFRRYLGCYQEAFEVGVVLGYAFRNRMATFARLLCHPDREGSFILLIQELARTRLTTQSGKPQSFFHLGMFAEEERVKSEWRASGITEPEVCHLQEHAKFSAKIALANLSVAVHTGVGLGSAFPELTEELWKAEHEHEVSREKWHHMRTLGVVNTDQPTEPVTLARRQEELLAKVGLFVSMRRPDLIAEFGVPTR